MILEEVHFQLIYLLLLIVGEGLHTDIDLIFEHVLLFSGYPEKIDAL